MTASPRPGRPAPERFPVVVVGAGPAGLTVGNVLRAAGLDCLVLETESRAFIEQRPRAGVVEEWAVRGLERRGLARRLLERAQVHPECEFRFAGERFRFRYRELTGLHHFVYPQQFLVTDHGTASADPYAVGVARARLRRLFTSPTAAAAFAEKYLGAGTTG